MSRGMGNSMATLIEFKEALLKYLERRSNEYSSESELERMKTHCSEILRVFELAMDGLVDKSKSQSHFISYGLVHEFEFLDGKRYSVLIKETGKENK